MKQATILGKVYIVNKNKSLTCPNGKTFSFGEMKQAQNDYKGMNRIHKPMALLFWSDVMNGKSCNWK